MMTLTANPRTINTPAPIPLPRRTEATKAPARRSFLQTLLRALAAVAV